MAAHRACVAGSRSWAASRGAAGYPVPHGTRGPAAGGAGRRGQVVPGVAEPLGRVIAAIPLGGRDEVGDPVLTRAYDLLRQEGYLQVGRKVGASVHVRRGPPNAEWHAELRVLLAAAYAKGMSSEEIVTACREGTQGFSRAAEPKGSLA